MRLLLMSALFLLPASVLWGQKTEQGFDFFFKPTEHVPRYFVITEKKDGLWHRKAYYLPERSMAMEGWYKDEACEKPQGVVKWYHTNRTLMSTGTYAEGLKEGLFLSYDAEGHLQDSAHYAAGRLKGMRLGWNSEGMQVDSMHFDGAGNGTQVTWYADGQVASAGYWVQDTLKKGRWKYYHANGQLKATEEYAGGERTAVTCYDESGKPLNARDCEEKEAAFSSGQNGWVAFINRKLKADVPVKMGAPLGQYTVVVQFIVGKDGSIEKVEPLTKFGYGMEEEVVRMIKASPRWQPALQWGKTVRAYRRQPITFVVSRG